jgi:hypothetical protein
VLLLESSTSEFALAEIDQAVAKWERLQFAGPLFVAPDDVPRSDWWQITHAASDASNSATKQVLRRAKQILGTAPKGLIQERIDDGDVAGALALFDWGGYEDSLAEGFTEIFQKIGIRSGADTAIEIGKGIDYDESNFIRESARGARIVAARVTKSTRRATSDALRRLIDSGSLSSNQVRINVFSLLGLDPMQANSGVNKIIAQREAGDNLAKVRKSTDKFAENARAVREERIARFENLNAAQTAQEDAVAQHVDIRALKNVVKVWVIVPDDSTCPICNRLNRQRQVEGDSFTDPFTGLTYIGPPAHQACRCGLRYLEARKDPRATGVFVVDIRVPDDDGPVTVGREELRARIFHLPGKHEQKSHGRKGGTARTVNYKEFTANNQSDGYSKAGVSEQEDLGAAFANKPFSRETSAAMDEAFDEARRRQRIVNSVRSYGGGGYIAINSRLRSGRVQGSAATESKIKDIDQAFAEVPPLKSAIIVQRGNKSNRFKGVKAGDEFQDLGYVSTSVSTREASAFKGTSGTLFKITVPKGTKALPIAAVTGEAFEKEIILPRGSKFKITKVTLLPGNQTIIEANLE